MRPKPALSFWQIFNMCFGFLGIQFGFALQNANVSRIFQTLGAAVDDIPALWIAAPLTGLIVQPIIGHYSDRTWCRFGRRRPYFFVGATLATLALLAMPNAPALWVAAGLLWIMDASFNVAMEPFRAFVGDQLPPRQRPLGYSMQSVFIGVGAVVASVLPWVFSNWLGLANTAAAGAIPETVKLSFYAGAAVLLGAVLWTVLSTREYPPETLANFDDAQPPTALAIPAPATRTVGIVWLGLGMAAAMAIAVAKAAPALYLLAALAIAWGLGQVWLASTASRGMLAQILTDLRAMPAAMRKLAWVQFFSWFALFAMWIYATPAVTASFYGSTDATSVAYNEGANWVGVLMGAYNGFAAIAALIIPLVVRRIGLRWSHLLNLWLGGAGLLSFLLLRDPRWLLISTVGVGFAWASIVSLPYAMLSDSLPAAKMGVYMGIFNFFIVIPQLLAASVLGVLLKLFFHDQPIAALALGGASLIVAGLCTLRLREPPTSAAPAS